ncbi:PorP/SprF family type IX secretion system membrane protein [Rufibacter quisquiliarum]
MTMKTSNTILQKICLQVVLVSALMGTQLFHSGGEALAQINPLGTMYFQNQYLGNPAMAGLDNGWKLNLAYRQQWNSFPGTPKTQSLTAEYGFGGNVGVGLKVQNTKAGLLRHTSAVGTYAYHLPVNEGQQLHFGLSVGVTNQRISNSDVVGENSDPSVSRFNDQSVELDGDFGLAFTTGKLTVQGALLGMRNYLANDPNEVEVINYPTFFTAVSYRFNVTAGGQAIGIEPKIAYRGMKETDNILDAGANLSFLYNAFNVFGLYHSNQEATFGFSVGYKSRLAFTGIYTTAPSDMKDYASGGFELGLKFALAK